MLEVLRKVELFQSMDDEELRRLGRFAVLEIASEGVDVFRAGQSSNALYIVRDGSVLILRDSIGRPVQLLARLGPYDYFGELGLFDDVAHSTTARAVRDTSLIRLPKDRLIPFLEEHPRMSLKVQMAAAKRHTMYAAAALELGRRTEVRIRVGREVELLLPDQTSRRVVLDNLSPGGLALQHPPSGWRIGDEVRFQMTARDVDPLDVEGRVSWQRGDRIGVSFGEISFAQEMKIRGVLKQLVGRLRRLETS